MGKCLKKTEADTRSGSGGSKTRTCKHYESLLFLRDTLVSRSTESNITEQSVSCQSPIQGVFSQPSSSPLIQSDASPISNLLPHGNSTTDSSSSIIANSASKRRRVEKKESTEERRDKIDLMLVEALKKPSRDSECSEANTLDADTLFCQSLISSLRQLPPKKSRLAKIDIQKVLFNYEFDDNETV